MTFFEGCLVLSKNVIMTSGNWTFKVGTLVLSWVLKRNFAISFQRNFNKLNRVTQKKHVHINYVNIFTITNSKKNINI